jgi:hypothetical protein
MWFPRYRSSRELAANMTRHVRLNTYICGFRGHHLVHWGHDGGTEVDNLVSLCRPHHRAVHEQGWRLHIADGTAVVEPPP